MTFIKLLLFNLVCSSISCGTFQNKLDRFEEFNKKINKLERSEIDPSISTGSFENKLGRFKRSEEKGNKLERSDIDPTLWINFVEQVLIEDPTVNKCFVSLNIISRKDSSQILNLAAFFNSKLTR
jgi:hypothetical protein